MVFLLRPLQQLFQSREYPGYTDTKFAWEDDDGHQDNGNEEQDVAAHLQESNVTANIENQGGAGTDAAVEENVPVEIPKKVCDSSDDEYSL